MIPFEIVSATAFITAIGSISLSTPIIGGFTVCSACTDALDRGDFVRGVGRSLRMQPSVSLGMRPLLAALRFQRFTNRLKRCVLREPRTSYRATGFCMPGHIDNDAEVRFDERHLLVGDTCVFAVDGDKMPARGKVYIGSVRGDHPIVHELYGEGAGRCLVFWSWGVKDGGGMMLFVPVDDITFIRRISHVRSGTEWRELDSTVVISNHITPITNRLSNQFDQWVVQTVGEINEIV